MQDCQRRWRWPLAVACVGLLTSAARAAPAEIEIENLRVGCSNNSEPNIFKVGTWTPVWVQLKTGADRFSGIMEVVVPDDDGTAIATRQVIDLGPRESQQFTTYVRPGSIDPEINVRLIDSKSWRSPKVVGLSQPKLDTLQPDETLLVTMGKPSGVDLITSLPGFSNDKNTSGTPLTIAQFDVLGGRLPGRWYGYDAAEAVVLDTNDREVMATLNTPRGQALAEWVRRGGHLVVSVGANWQQVRDSFLGPMLPAVLAGQERIGDLASLETFAGANKPITPPGTAPVSVTKLDEVEARGGKVLSMTATVPLVARGPYGFGRVTVVALDVDQRPFADWPDRPLFWTRALDLHRQGAETIGPGPGMGGSRRLYQSGVSDLSTQLRKALEQFPGIRLIPFGWVAFFIFLYILLIGPGDYLFLKKVLKRMELTWITFPTIVVTVSLLAYFAAYFVKGRTLRVNQVDVVDVDQASGQSRGSTWLNVFSPQNRDYDVSIVPLPLDRDTPPGSVAGPPPGSEVLMSWFGVPEPGFGGMGGKRGMGFSSGGYAAMPIGASERLEGVRIPIWSTKCLTARWFARCPSLLDSDLQPVGTDRLGGTVTNRLGVPLHDAILAFGKEVYTLGTIAPGAFVRVELSQERVLSGLLKSIAPHYMPAEPWNSPKFRINRHDLMLALIFHDSESTTTSEAPMASNPLHYLDLTGQLALERPMLVARVDRPATQLILGRATSPPQIDRTTVLRVILPLGRPKSDSSR